MRDDDGRTDSVHNRAVGGHHNNNLQAGSIHGDVHFHGRDESGDIEDPVIATVEVDHELSTLVADDDPPREITLSGKLHTITLEARTTRAVVLTAMRPVVTSRRCPRRACVEVRLGGILVPRPFTADFDTDPPQLRALEADFPFTISATDVERFHFVPRVRADEVGWRLELDWICAGRRGTTVIDDNGIPFAIYPEAALWADGGNSDLNWGCGLFHVPGCPAQRLALRSTEGIVGVFNDAHKGGTIHADTGGAVLSFDRTAIDLAGSPALTSGQRVRFEAVMTPNGPEVITVGPTTQETNSQDGTVSEDQELTAALSAVVAANRGWLAANDPEAGELLDRLAFLAAEAVPIAADTDSIRRLVDLGLAVRVGDAVQVSRPVQTLIRAQVADPERTLQAAGDLLASASCGDPDDPASWPTYRLLTSHLRALLNHPAATSHESERVRALLIRVLRYLFVTGQYRSAASIAHTAYQDWTTTLDADHPDTLALANRLAGTLYGLGKYTAARALFEDTLERRRRVLGADDPGTLTLANNLSACLNIFGEHDEAKALCEDTLRRSQRVHGADHPDTLRVATSLAVSLNRLEEYAAERELNEDTLRRSRRVHGADHPDTLAVAANLAFSLRALGEHEAARTLDEETLEHRKRVLGEDHPDTMTLAKKLAKERDESSKGTP